MSRTPRWSPGFRRPAPLQAAIASIEAACRLLRLPDQAVATATRHGAGYKTFLAELLVAECDERETRHKIRAVNAAAFPRIKRFQECDFAANTTSPRGRAPPR